MSNSTQGPTERVAARGLQRFDIKIGLDIRGAATQDEVCDRLIAVFGRWRLEDGEEIVDLQDYSHVPNGPGIVLVSKRWVLSVDYGAGRPGFLLSNRKGLEGSTAERLAAATKLALAKCQRLLDEAEMDGVAPASSKSVTVALNDRLHYPPTDATDAELAPAMQSLAGGLFGQDGNVERTDVGDGRLTYVISAATDVSIADLQSRIK